MRTSTKSAIGAITWGVLTLTYNIGQQAVVVSNSFSAPPSANPSVAQPTISNPPVSNPTVSNTPAAKPTPAVRPSASSSASSSTAVTAPVQNSNTADGSVVQSGYGTVQVQVTKTAGKISDVTMLLSNATNGRSAAFSYLVKYAIDANGSSFANLSGATYTTNAFKKSLDAALAKL